MAVLTINQKLDQVNNFISSIEDSKNSYYFFVGKAEPWRDENGNADETKVPESNNSITQIEQEVYKDLVYGKLLDSSDVISMVKRYNWTNNSIFARYNNNDPDIYSKNFYVITDTNNVYKCINNGYSTNSPNGIPSTVKPTITQTAGTFTTYDGYIWKYMFTCDPTQYVKFQTKDYIPVTPNNDVIKYSVNGTIDAITLINGGENYQVFEEGFLERFVNNQVVQLQQISSPYDNYYKNSAIYLKAGFGGGQVREITSSSGLYKTISVSPPFNYYENLKLKEVNGIFTIGDLVRQTIYNIKYIYEQGFLNIGDTLIQSDTGGTGTIIASNNTVLKVETDSSIPFNVLYPLVDTTTSTIQKNGLVDIIDDSTEETPVGRLLSEIIANSGPGTPPFSSFTGFNTRFESDFSVGHFVRVGNEENKNIRRITRIADPNFFTRTITANTLGANSSDDIIKLSNANTFYRVNDKVLYYTPTSNTVIGGLANNTYYYVSFTNSSSFSLSATFGGPNVNITETRETPGEEHSIKYTIVNRNITANTLGANVSANVFILDHANTFLSVRDKIFYSVPYGGKPLGQLVGNSYYYISFANTSSFALAKTDTIAEGFSANVSLEDRRLKTINTLGVYTINEDTYTPKNIIANTFYINDDINAVSNVIYLDNANTYYAKNDKILYLVPESNTAIGGLVNNSMYYISFANTSAFALSSTVNGTNVNISETRETPGEVHTIKFVQDEQTITVFPYMLVDQPFLYGQDNKTIHLVPTALSVDSFNKPGALGSIVYVNLNSAEITFANIHPVDQSFIVGESLIVVDNANNNLFTNGTVSFTNTHTVILSNVQGDNFVPVNESYRPSYLYGLTSKLKAEIVDLITSPNITVETQEGGFARGGTIFVSTADNVPTANAKIISKYSTPNDLTEYVIGPRVNIDGDGNGALAFCTVDLSDKNPTRKISSVTLINHGQNYTRANVSVTSNTLYGIGAVFETSISPVNGHGFDAYTELNSIYCGISKKFENAINESFYIPSYGSYRKIGIIKNPFINDAIFEVNNFDRVSLKYDLWNSIYFADNEIVVQPGTNSAGIVVSSNSTVVKLKNVKGKFLQDPDILSNTTTAIYGWISGANAHVTNSQITYFTLASDVESLSEEVPGGTAKINQIFVDAGNLLLFRNIVANTFSEENPLGIDSANDVIQLNLANTIYKINDIVTYLIPSDGTAIGGLLHNKDYYVSFVNSTSFALSDEPEGSNVDLYETRTTTPNTYSIYANTARVNASSNSILLTTASDKFSINDKIYYSIPEGNTVIDGLENFTYYYIRNVNSTAFSLSTTKGGDEIAVSATKIVDESIVNRTDDPGEEHSIFITPEIHQFRFNVTEYDTKNTSIRVTDVLGSFSVGDNIYEPRTDAHAQITKILTANGEKNSSTSFGKKFNQTARITLSSNTDPFEKYEYVYQSDTYATGQIISTNDELDIQYIQEANFVVGEKIFSTNTNATAIITGVNTTNKILKVAAVSTDGFDDFTNKAFNPADTIKNSSETKTTVINKVYSVLVLADIGYINNNDTTPYLGKFRIGNNNIIGYTSNTYGETVLSDSIIYPDLVKQSGKVMYIDNISKFDKTPSSNEQLKLIIKF